jgi:hypothetical protein
MDTLVCGEVQALLQAVPRAKNLLRLLERFGEHVRDCADCQHALVLLAASLQIAAPPSQASYETCEDDLAAYLELEHSQGWLIAARRYPHVWWSLWLDLESAEVYEGMFMLFGASQEGRLEAMPWPNPPVETEHPVAQRSYLYTLPRITLAYTVKPPAQYGAWRGGQQGPQLVLDEEEVEGSYQLSLSVDKQAEDLYSLIFCLEPSPEAADLIVTIGSSEYRAGFDENNQAVIHNLPGDQIASPEGPDLLIYIEHSA